MSYMQVDNEIRASWSCVKSSVPVLVFSIVLLLDRGLLVRGRLLIDRWSEIGAVYCWIDYSIGDQASSIICLNLILLPRTDWPFCFVLDYSYYYQ